MISYPMIRKIQIEKITKSLLKEAQSYFLDDFILLPPHSLIARYLISKKIKEVFGVNNYLPKNTEAGKPCFEKNIYWSISYKEDWVAIAVFDRPIGIDLEILIPRDASLFSFISDAEWKIIGKKSWKNFYILWTGKEALIKKLNLNIDAIKSIILTKKKEDIVSLAYNKRSYEVHTFQKDNLCYSLT